MAMVLASMFEAVVAMHPLCVRGKEGGGTMHHAMVVSTIVCVG